MVQAPVFHPAHEALQTAPCDRSRCTAPARDVDPVLWEEGFGAQAKDGRFYRIAEECLVDQFAFRYIVLRNARTGVAALQPALLVDQDGAAGLPARARKAVAAVRRMYPRFLRLKLLMVGCAAGEGHPGSAAAMGAAGAPRGAAARRAAPRGPR